MNYATASLKELFIAADRIGSQYQETVSQYFIQEDLNDCIEDTADNYTQEHSEYYCLPSNIFEAALFSLLLEYVEQLIEDFATNPHKYLTSNHQAQLDTIALEYLADS